MARQPSIIAVTRLADGRLIAAATDRRTNSLWQFDLPAWSQLAEWTGKEITACCGVGDDVVCPALDGQLFVWSHGQLHQHALPDKTMWIYAAAALDDGRALLGGNGGLVFFEPATGQLVHRRLSEYDVKRPGRTIHGISRSEGRTFIVGAKNLVLELRGDAPVEIADRSTFAGRELLFLSAASVTAASDSNASAGGRLWLAGHGLLASLDEGGPHIFENPLGDRNRLVGIASHCGQLVAFQDEIMLGEPGAWRPLIEGFNAPGLIAVEPLADDQWCAITHTGESYLFNGDSVQPSRVF
jgi:hypothetical protein